MSHTITTLCAVLINIQMHYQLYNQLHNGDYMMDGVCNRLATPDCIKFRKLFHCIVKRIIVSIMHRLNHIDVIQVYLHQKCTINKSK